MAIITYFEGNVDILLDLNLAACTIHSTFMWNTLQIARLAFDLRSGHVTLVYIYFSWSGNNF